MSYSQEQIDQMRASEPRVTLWVGSDYSHNQHALPSVGEIEELDVDAIMVAVRDELARCAEEIAARADEAQAELDRENAAAKAVLEKTDDITLGELIPLVDRHVHDVAVPGLERLPAKRQSARRDRRGGDLFWQLQRADYKRVPENLDEHGRLKNEYDRHASLTPGPLFSKRLREITAEDCFITVLEDGKRVPIDTPFANFLRPYFKAAQTIGLIDSNPASLAKPKQKPAPEQPEQVAA